MGLVDSQGNVLAHYPDPARMVGTKISETAFFQNILANGGQGTGEQPGLDGQLRLYAFTPFTYASGGPIYLWAGIDKNTVTAAADHQLLSGVALWLGLALVSFLVVWFVGDRLFIRPVSVITETARKLSSGDYLARTGMVADGSEVGELAAMVDRMAASMASKAEILRLNRALRVLSGCSKNIVLAQSEEALLDETCRTIVEAGNYLMAWITFRVQDDAKSVHIAARHGANIGWLDGVPISWSDDHQGGGPTGKALRTGQTQLVQDIAEELDLGPWQEKIYALGSRSAVALPLTDGGIAFGALTIHAAQAHIFNPEEVALLEELAGNLTFGILTQRSKQERQRAEERVERLARFDTATDLPNALELVSSLELVIRRSLANRGQFALVTMHIERLLDIQDVIGMAGADEIVRQLAQRVSAVTGGVHFIARVARDAFAMIMPLDVESLAAIPRYIEAITEVPYEYAGIPVDIQISAGSAVYPEHATDPDALVRRSDIAARQAWSQGVIHNLYGGESERESPERLTLLSDLRQAIRTDQLVLFYQPKVSAQSPAVITGAEALVRWFHPLHGAVSPASFIPLAEQTGLIKPLTYAVIEMAARQVATWQHANKPMRVAVNISPQNLLDPDFFDFVSSLSERTGADLSALDLEITETALMSDPERARQVLEQFARQGMRIFIDDFGTGYSSLAYLATLPIYALKIDRSFVMRMNEPKYQTIVSSTISLAHGLGLKVVAEGVETREQAEFLRDQQCDDIQGYLYSSPKAAEEFVEWCEVELQTINTR
ncbi:EAL domain-containing protein [Silvimonas sp.]|uniref:bifunctional diguanylate cyclase/phosphodiesterase n=1 Tax=Silvimonas sp. TaxID=2650811 RepID=UPI00283CA8CD|nr:EAL domain-containing protein [Silvimonas sp.]MDR3428761.1 EAL domain-containing protein [Silvimonas sp.]